MIKALIVVSLLSGVSAPKDSVGVETINGKVFVIHKVDEKETLYAISRRYRTTVEAIIEYNPGTDKALEIGQILRVPFTPPVTAANGAVIHAVEAGETLYSISRKFDVSVDDLRRLNKLTSDAISVGQQLVVRRNTDDATRTEPEPPAERVGKGQHRVEAQETLYSISREYNVTVDDLKRWNDLGSADLQIGQVLAVVPPVSPSPNPTPTDNAPVAETVVAAVEKEKEEQPRQTVVQPHTIRISESIKNGSETVESGIAELIEGTEGNRKYLALHRTAPIGSILKIRNEMNKREVFVRVMGKLPDTALTDKVLIRISRSAYDRLGAIDQRFRVEVTYYK